MLLCIDPRYGSKKEKNTEFMVSGDGYGTRVHANTRKTILPPNHLYKMDLPKWLLELGMELLLKY